MLSAIVMVAAALPVPPEQAPTVQQYLPRDAQAHAAARARAARAVVQRFIQASSPKINLAQLGPARSTRFRIAPASWCAAISKRQRERSRPSAFVAGGPTLKDKTRELVLFSISEEFFAVRAQLGIALTA